MLHHWQYTCTVHPLHQLLQLQHDYTEISAPDTEISALDKRG